MAVTPNVAPGENDMMFPLIVISVMPIATQPMNDTVVSSERMLGAATNPGVVRTTAASTRRPITWAAEKTCVRFNRERALATIVATEAPAAAVGGSLTGSPAADG